MGKIISGTFNGTGAGLYLCIGFLPDWVKVRNVEATNAYWNEWSRNWRSGEQTDGCRYGTAAGVTVSVLTPGQGIQPYEGGDALTSANQTSTTYGEGIYLAQDRKDYRGVDIAAGASVVDAWTLQTSGNRSGKFNGNVAGTYIGEGSRICIDNKWYSIISVAAGQGAGTDEVVLSRAAATGDIQFIGGMYDYAPLALGSVTPAGFKINDTTTNVDGNICYFEAGCYDN